MSSVVDLNPIQQFLGVTTPEAWVAAALEQLDILLIDHAHCEKKAASTAMSLIYRYTEQTELLQKLSRLVREEMRHFEQVLALMTKRGIALQKISASRYAQGLHELIRGQEPDKLIDTLIVGAFIEARSCERFAALVPHLDDELSKFYQQLLSSEARHFQMYLRFAEQLSSGSIDGRVALFRAREVELITSPDSQFRFHSGVPAFSAITDCAA